jgi:hypothetical protein
MIGKSANPRCFKNVPHNNLSVTYSSQKKAWMTSRRFQEWLKEIDNHFRRLNRKVLLLIDNAPVHDAEIALDFVTVYFLPPNTTSHLQPCDAGIIRTFKAYYRRILLQKIIRDFDGQKAEDEKAVVDVLALVKAITLMDAQRFVGKAWNLVTAKTIANCWRKTRILPDALPSTSESNSASISLPSSSPASSSAGAPSVAAASASSSTSSSAGSRNVVLDVTCASETEASILLDIQKDMQKLKESGFDMTAGEWVDVDRCVPSFVDAVCTTDVVDIVNEIIEEERASEDDEEEVEEIDLTRGTSSLSSSSSSSSTKPSASSTSCVTVANTITRVEALRYAHELLRYMPTMTTWASPDELGAISDSVEDLIAKLSVAKVKQVVMSDFFKPRPKQ